MKANLTQGGKIMCQPATDTARIKIPAIRKAIPLHNSRLFIGVADDEIRAKCPNCREVSTVKKAQTHPECSYCGNIFKHRTIFNIQRVNLYSEI